ncbi:MAG: transpeptidase family protein [Muribaculum sp.]|nr:transpeptidase family protein [Muribaculum sp.]
MAKKLHTNKYRTLTRYGFITVGFLLISALIVAKLFTTTVVEADEWNARARADLSRQVKILPERGNILSDNGNILACNIQVYDIRIDMSHPAITSLGKKAGGFKWKEINELADSLDNLYPLVDNFAQLTGKDREENSWRKRLALELNKAPEKRSKRLTICRKRSLDDFEHIKALPFLNQWKNKSGYRNPVYTEALSQRIYPYGSMAKRSIGRVNEDEKTGEFHGFSGVECDLDSLLYGRPGIARKVTLNSGVSNWVSQPAVRGYDIQTTFDIDLQDMLEEELTKVCMDVKGEWGTAILMEVATGEIKAIANVQHLSDGSYGEALNRAVRGFEPGSVMKPISLMIALEDGLVANENSTVDCSPFQRTSDHAGGGIKTMKQVIETSSNTGIARVIFRGYQNNPEKYYDRLAQIGFFEPMKSGIDYKEVPYMRRLTEYDKRGRHTMTERHLDLARQAYGYTTTIPPIYTLAIYNAIANDGKYVRPHVMRRMSNEFVDSVIPISYIRDRICSSKTARAVRVCLREPVWGSRGTARAVQDDRVEIAGKTGTAYPMKSEKGGGYDTSRRRYAFAGFFPYSNPKYSCMVLILAPAGTSAARSSGQVLKNVAVKMYARGMLDNTNPFTAQRSAVVPLLPNMTLADRGQLSTSLKLPGMRTYATGASQSGTVPSVVGYDAASAVNILEKAGLNVTLSGTGHVKSQSQPAGGTLRKGSRIHLTLGQTE